MIEYKLHGLHCENCADRLVSKFKTLEYGLQIQFDSEDQLLRVPDEVNLAQVKLILNSEKVLLEEYAEADTDAHTHHSDHDGHHHHAPDFTKAGDSANRMKIVFFLNLLFSIAEMVFGILFNSAAILSDAVHDLGDALSIGLAWFFQRFSTKEANERFTFGHRRFSLLGAWITSVFLIVGSILVVVHSVPLLFNPEPVNFQGMFWLAIVAILINGYATWLLSGGSSANEKVLSVHLLEDMLGWVGVLVVSIVLRFQPWYFLDPLLSIAIAAFILSRTLPTFIESSRVFLESVPPGVDLMLLNQQILDIPMVHTVSHLHLWSIDGEENAFTVTVFVSTEEPQAIETIRDQIQQQLLPYSVTHSTIEIVPDLQELVI